MRRYRAGLHRGGALLDMGHITLMQPLGAGGRGRGGCCHCQASQVRQVHRALCLCVMRALHDYFTLPLIKRLGSVFLRVNER